MFASDSTNRRGSSATAACFSTHQDASAAHPAQPEAWRSEPRRDALPASDRGAAAAEQRGGVSRSKLLYAAAACMLLGGPPPAARAALIEEDVAQRVFDAARPSVVSVHTRSKQDGEGLGSGVVWDTRGHLLTNYHVVQKLVTTNTQVLTVSLADATGRRDEYPAAVLGTDPDHDLAVLKIDALADVLHPISIGESRGLRVGQALFAIGSPFGYGQSLSAGVVSGLNRSIASPVGTIIRGAIQTDAAISSGNSGGPLLDSSGRLVGVNTSSYTRVGTGRSSGVNFALPIDLAMSIIPNLIVSGTNRRPAVA